MCINIVMIIKRSCFYAHTVYCGMLLAGGKLGAGPRYDVVASAGVGSSAVATPYGGAKITPD